MYVHYITLLVISHDVMYTQRPALTQIILYMLHFNLLKQDDVINFPSNYTNQSLKNYRIKSNRTNIFLPLYAFCEKLRNQTNTCEMICLSSSSFSQDAHCYLVTGPVHSCAISTSRRAYSPAAISAHETYRTHCQLCPANVYRNNVPILTREEHHISLKILQQARFETAGHG